MGEFIASRPGTASRTLRQTPAARPLAGILLLIVSMWTLNTLDASGKWVMGIGMPLLVFCWVRYLVHFMIVLAAVLPTQGARALRGKHRSKHDHEMHEVTHPAKYQQWHADAHDPFPAGVQGIERPHGNDQQQDSSQGTCCGRLTQCARGGARPACDELSHC